MPFSNSLATLIKDLLVSNTQIPSFGNSTRYVALHSADPTSDCTSSELSGDGYARTLTTFDFIQSAEGIALRNNAIVLFPTSAGTKAGQVTHFSVWDSASGGTPIGYGVLSVPTNWTLGINLSLAVNALVLTIIKEL